MDPKEQLESLRRTLAEEEENLLFIEEQKAKHVLETEVPPTLIKEEWQKQKRIEELRRRIEELERSQVNELPIEDEDLREKELAYLDGLLKRYEYWRDHYTPLAGIAEVRAAVEDGPRLDLPMPFIPPEFEKLVDGFRPQAEVRREPVDDLRQTVAQHRRIILLGDPGSGKTTTLWRMVYDYAFTARQDAQAPLPVLVPLGGYTDDGPFDAYLARHLGSLAPHLETYRTSGRLILLLDGLDEMPQAEYSERMDRIKETLKRYSDETVVITCRALDYMTKLEKLQKIEVAPLDEPRIRTFLHNYLGKTAGERLFRSMGGDTSRVAGKELPPLLALGRNPYLLLIAAQIYASTGGELPANRARLFTAFVDTLIRREEQRHPQGWIEIECQKDALASLAYAMHTEQRRGTTVEHEWALARLCEAKPDRDAKRLLRLAISSTLLGTDDTTVRFFHRSLQEFFVAQWLAPKLLDGSAPKMAINEEIRSFVRGLLADVDQTSSPPGGVEVPEGMVWVPSGPFICGGGKDTRVVQLDQGFFISRYPVTNAEFARFVERTRHTTMADKEGGCSDHDRVYVYTMGYNWRRPYGPDSNIEDRLGHPVVQVNWDDAKAYAEWVGGRLPTEEEWEKAARGIDGHIYPWGDEFDPTLCNTCRDYIRTTTPVGYYSPQGDSPYGCADMAGNVWEWTVGGLELGDEHSVMRGGAFDCEAGHVRCYYRVESKPTPRDFRTGFRVVVIFPSTSNL
jgi:formylglycine-generating enzyme required for sulfatase activity